MARGQGAGRGGIDGTTAEGTYRPPPPITLALIQKLEEEAQWSDLGGERLEALSEIDERSK